MTLVRITGMESSTMMISKKENYVPAMGQRNRLSTLDRTGLKESLLFFDTGIGIIITKNSFKEYHHSSYL